MKRIQNSFLHWTLSLVFILSACEKEVADENLSTFSSISVETLDAIIPSFIIDKTGQYLIVFIRDVTFSNTVVKKINLKTLKVEGEFRASGTVPISLTNILLTDRNEVVTTFFHFDSKSMLIYKFDVNLNVLKIDTAAVVLGGNLGRRRMVKTGPNRITGVETNLTPSFHFYLRYMTLDDDLNILNEVLDSSDEYGSGLIIPQQFIQTNDGGTLYVGENNDEPLYYDDIIIEKRDANFNLQWRSKYRTLGNNSASGVKEYNGKYYVWSHGQDKDFKGTVYMLVYDQQGNLIENKSMPHEGIISKDAENMVITENGDFLMLALNASNANPNVNKGLLFHSNSSMTNITYKTFGGERAVQVSALLPREPNRFLLMYIDRSFAPDGQQPRLVFRYVDALGNFIE